MASGGHARSGPAKQEGSARSEAQGYKLTELPPEGYAGEIPPWPLTPEAGEVEARYWERAWRTPQACIWSRQEWRWLIPDVARWVRLTVRCDELDAGATLLARLPSAADGIGMTPAGLARMGGKIKPDEVGERRTERPEPQQKRGRRLRDVSAG